MMRPETDNHLRYKIIELRGEATQDEMADKLGIPRSTYRNWENGTRKIKAADIAALANVYKVSADELLGIPEKETGLSAEAAARIKAWSKERYTAVGFTEHSEIESPLSTLYDTFEQMIECEEFEPFLQALSSVGANVRLETSLAKYSKEYDSILFSEHIGYILYKLAKQAELLAKKMYSVDEAEKEVEEILEEGE